MPWHTYMVKGGMGEGERGECEKKGGVQDGNES